MYEADVLAHFAGVPVFRLADMTQMIQNRVYAKKFLQRMVREGKISRIERDFYTVHEDAFLVSTHLVKPSYISCISALSFHRMTTQIPKDVFCITSKRKRTISFISEISYFHTEYFFGFEMQEYGKFSIPVATPEKAVIDSIGVMPFSVFDEEAFERLNADLLIGYLGKIKKSSIVKRIGFLAERNGLDVFGELKDFLNDKYVLLDPLAEKGGKRDKKWKVVVNG